MANHGAKMENETLHSALTGIEEVQPASTPGDKNEKTIREYYQLMGERQFTAATRLMAEDACVYLPNTREVFRGRESYILFNERYPGHWHFDIEKTVTTGETAVISAAVKSEWAAGYHVAAFFTFENGLITEICAYWGEDGEPPEWRMEEKLSERY